jgi:hypothetical protein
MSRLLTWYAVIVDVQIVGKTGVTLWQQYALVYDQARLSTRACVRWILHVANVVAIPSKSKSKAS